MLRAVLVRSGLFVFFASATWALLPLTAHARLHLGSGGYGVLQGAVGVGAVACAVLLPRLRAACSADLLATASAAALAGVAVVLALVHVTILVGVALAFGGVAWIVSLATLNAAYQASLRAGSRPAG